MNDHNNYKNDYWTYASRFGEIAVMKGFVTASEVEEALSEQISNCHSTILGSHKLIGEILFQKGQMTFEKVLIVLEELAEKEITTTIR